MPKRKFSRQWSWALRNQAKGRCTRCNKKRSHYKWLCDYCQGKNTAYIKRWRRAQKKAAQVKARMLR